MTLSQRRRDTQHLISSVARCDPVADRPTAGWSRTAEAGAILRRIAAGELGSAVAAIPGTPPRRRGGRPVILVAALLITGAGVAAASQLLGGPAPSQVKEDIANVDQGIPPDLRYDPDVRDARLVARADGASIYAANLPDGGYCSEIVTPVSGPAGAVCVPAGSEDPAAIHVTAPFDDPLTLSSPFIVGGRADVSGAVSLLATFADGGTQPVTLGDDGFFVFAVASDRLAQAHRRGLTLVAIDAVGTQIASVDVPPTDFSNPEKQDARQPIFVSTISTGNDFTKVLGVEGSVNVAGAVTLELRYPDGTSVDIPFASDGHYHYDLPERRTDELFDTPGQLIARDEKGNELATAPVAAVAYWRSTP
jgi:hypothetical protein